MTALLYFLNVVCSAGQSALGKHYAHHGGNPLRFNITRAAIGAVIFLVYGIITGFSFHLPTILFGVGYGISLSISMQTGLKALGIGPMALTSTIAAFSLVIPFFFGIFFWDEQLTLFKTIGIILLLLSMLLINRKKESGFSTKWALYSLATLLTNGICSVIQKLHQIKFPTLYRTEFMFWSMLCITLVLVVTAQANGEKKEVFRLSLPGLLAGITSCSSTYIVLYLSAAENASVLFPIVSIAQMIAVWGIGVLCFKEKLKLLQTIGLVIGIASIVLLKI